MKKLCYLFALISLMTLSSCAFGGDANKGTAEVGKLSPPVNVVQNEGQPVGGTCYTEAGSCSMEQPLPLNGPCTCVILGYGSATGKVGN